MAVVSVAAVLAASCAGDDPIAGSDGYCELRSPDTSGAEPGDDHRDVDWVVDMDMFEFGYSCALPALDAGTVLQIDFTNVGAVAHEAVIGDLDTQNDHEAAMADGDEHADDPHADDPHADDHDADVSVPQIELAAGDSGSLIVELDEPGDLVIGCHIAGHWAAGMRADFRVGI